MGGALLRRAKGRAPSVPTHAVVVRVRRSPQGRPRAVRRDGRAQERSDEHGWRDARPGMAGIDERSGDAGTKEARKKRERKARQNHDERPLHDPEQRAPLVRREPNVQGGGEAPASGVTIGPPRADWRDGCRADTPDGGLKKTEDRSHGPACRRGPAALWRWGVARTGLPY